jgi:predicted transcriptional regulator
LRARVRTGTVPVMSRADKDIESVDPLVGFMGLQRELQGITQLSLSKRIGTTPQQLSHYENGRTVMPLAKLRRALHELGWSVEAVPLSEDP